MSDVTQLKCGTASASEAGGEIFQVLFEASPEQEDGPYVLLQRAWLEEDDGASSPFYVETHVERLIGHYPVLEAELSRSRLTLQLPPPTDEIIEIDFATLIRAKRCWMPRSDTSLSISVGSTELCV